MAALSPEQIAQLHALPVEKAIAYWEAMKAEGKRLNKLPEVVRMLCLADLYYLLVQVCGRVDMLPCVGRPGFIDNQFAFERCREVEANPDGYLDLWSRELWKSSIITFGLTIQNILKDPDITVGIFSHTRPIAKAFLRQIMRELESNRTLHAAFPDILWGENVKMSPKWAEDDGLIMRRKSNPNEATVEAWGLVDGQPVSKHFDILIYDDIVVKESVSTPEMIQKTMTALEQSYNLGVTPGGVKRFAGTRWHFNDAYKTIIERETVELRFNPGRKDGMEDGESPYWDEKTHAAKRKEMGPYTYAANVLLNPKADAMQGFRREWLRFYKKLTNLESMNGYILVDAASSKKRGSDFTSMKVVALNVDKNYYVADMVRDRLNLAERTDRLFRLHRKWSDAGLKIIQVRYERYGMMADIEALKAKMERENYRFAITEVAGQTSKTDRIKRLIPLFEQGRLWLPESLYVTDWQKNTVDLVHAFVEESYMAFPVGLHDDDLDDLSRICEPDLQLVWPMAETKPQEPKQFEGDRSLAWMA